MHKLTRRSPHEYELLPRASFEGDAFPNHPPRAPSTTSPSWFHRWSFRIPGVGKLSDRAVYTHYVTPRRRKRSVLRLIYWSIFSVPYILLLLVLVAGIFFPSYTVRPAHYTELRQRASETTAPGRGNPHREKVFIAAALSEEKGHLTSGAWGRAVLQLVDLLGPENVHLSIYEDNTDAETKLSLTKFRHEATCNATIVFEQLDLASLPRITLPTGETRLKRIAFLAEVRNRALAPIDSNGVRFDRVLYLNDVIFDPVEATQLLFATNIDSNGRANYAAACAVDFIMPFKFYDRFATRDLDGHSTGLPFFPWFTSAGTGTSRSEVIAGKDAVRVRSCWGGMTAFEARWFQDQASVGRGPATGSTNTHHGSLNPQVSPLRFRYDTDTFWESSECCLINADLQYRRSGQGMPADSGIYLNPFVRVAYDETTLTWLSIIRRPEGLYSLIHDILNYFVGFPDHPQRLGEEPGQFVTDTVWVYDDPIKGFASNATQADLKGHYMNMTRIAEPGSFCGSRNLLVINEKPEHGPGAWGKIWPPRPPNRR
ncbi:glycosyltransferase family 69 protein [Cucurbitaria berberidis CBS 394.84]|uniref:Glycosyltransferase family 69 protein n=1 Tax=Cucurbitaria berberidis CBS 394.84 TaxID=1168544 RepID=A0A9P4GLX7_9PLEO|nr:glycosyltransferase family 69 protein [Cucurbitaria berberidis CBS 394.84]KAF1847465.1 glycosyltransferase family 69 protein [Cucurbitaria berberidis CBS 394.84]